MNYLIQYFFGRRTGVVLLPVIIFFAAVGAYTSAQAQIDSVWFNSGYNYSTSTLQSAGENDVSWNITADPLIGTVEPRPATVSQRYSAWTSPRPNSMWIANNQYGTQDTNGIYAFTRIVTLDNSARERELVVEVYADDNATVFLNDSLVGATPNSAYGTPVTHLVDSTYSHFRKGANTLRVEVHNTGSVAMGTNVTGFIFSIIRNPLAKFSANEVCAGDTTLFYDSSLARGGTITQWKWNFGDGATSTLKNPKHKYAAPGIYSVKYVVVDDSMLTDTITKNVRVKATPVASAGSDVPVCRGNGVRIGGSPTGPATATFLWSPTTGLNSSSISNPVASPAATTQYIVTVLDSDGCSSSDTVLVTVSSPTANAGNDVSICKGGSTQLNASGGTSYVWTPSTGLSNQSVSNPIASPSSTITYTVYVTKNGCTATDSVTVTVNPIPIANAGVDVAICKGESTQLTASGGTSYVWTPAAGLSNPNISNPMASPTVTTKYIVDVSKSGCSARDTVTVTVKPGITANAGNDVSMCKGDSKQLTATGGTSYAWTPATGLNNPNISNPMASPLVTTTYTVLVSKNGCTATDSVTVTVNSPTANAGVDVTICKGDSKQLTATGGTSYVWTPVTGLNNPNISNPMASPTVTTIYIVRVSNSGCTARDTVTVTVNPVPTANAGNDISICKGESKQLTASGGTSYAWTPSTGLSNPNISNPMASPAVTTMYTVLVSKDGCSATDSVTVTVNPAPTATASPDRSICFGDSVQLAVTGTGNYVWTPAAGLSDPTIANPIAKPTVTTTYTVRVTNVDGCSASDSVVITVLAPVTYTISPSPVDLHAVNIDSTKRGTVEFANTSSTRIHIRSAKFVNSQFNGSMITAFPISLGGNEKTTIEFTAIPRSEGIFSDTLCVEVDSACPVTTCVPVFIEGVTTCLKPLVSDVRGKRPGEVMLIPIVVEPSTKFKTAQQVDVTVKFTAGLLRLTENPHETIGKISNVIENAGEVSFTVIPDSMPGVNTTIAVLPIEALLSTISNGHIEVTSSLFTLKTGEVVTGSSCPSDFSLDSSCVTPSEFKLRSSVEIEGIYPNPSYTTTRVTILAKNNPRIRAEVYDRFGRQVEVLLDGEITDPHYTMMINTEKYAAGIYFCRLLHSGHITTKAFNVVR